MSLNLSPQTQQLPENIRIIAEFLSTTQCV